ncbi:FkbM family methyltransferase [Paradesertivirga mongoliensis]|uniref:FkbM family methyltransferase n=1 Tax=Paradesertivirga mongoliensis TaxID=2100740 RepID=A0ABW4ZGF6_9SPHI|nr:FkbM family methyltransferase [Pedobacter mongoliensis]
MTLRSLIKQRLISHFWNLKKKFKYFSTTVYFPKDSALFKRAMKEGIYEYDNLKIIRALAKRETTVLDVGANIGLMAIPLLNMDDSLKIISIEASPNTLPYLNKTWNDSNYHDRWQIIGNAVSDRSGIVDFHLAKPSDGAYDSIRDTQRKSYSEVVKVECTTIDEIWDSVQRTHISLIKIDIEGADLLALKGATNCIEKCRPAILMEWNQTNIQPFGLNNNDLIEFVRSNNYYLYALPEITKISSSDELNLFSIRTENFLLLPSMVTN